MVDMDVELAERALRQSDRKAYFEQRLFVLSPFGTFPTALILFIALVGSYAIVALLQQTPAVAVTASGIAFDGRTQSALILSLMLCTALFLQRYARVREREEREAFAAILRDGDTQSRQLVSLTPPTQRLWWATGIGLVLGLGLSWALFTRGAATSLRSTPALMVWFTVVTTLLTMSFTRGIELGRAGTRSARKMFDSHLQIDLLRIDNLSVLGRSAARHALIWFAVGAVACLFFVSGGLTRFTVSLIALFAALGIGSFFGTMEHVHQKIRAAKHAELERIRGQIDPLRTAAANDPSAATRLQGLLAYETRVSQAQEWPFDQTTLVRVGASALILTVPWFGQAIAAYAIEHLGHIGG